jgi:hypothetical protein
MGNITAKICEVWSEFNIFAPWLPWQWPQFWIFNPPKAATHYDGFRFFLAYIVPLDVGVVPIKFHQFLFGE